MEKDFFEEARRELDEILNGRDGHLAMGGGRAGGYGMVLLGPVTIQQMILQQCPLAGGDAAAQPENQDVALP